MRVWVRVSGCVCGAYVYVCVSLRVWGGGLLCVGPHVGVCGFMCVRVVARLWVRVCGCVFICVRVCVGACVC